MDKTTLKKGLALSESKGFTLIELLIVIGILAILATVTLLVLNPAQMFAQARDSQRISDLGSIKNAVGLYISTVQNPSLASVGSCVTNYWGTEASTTGGSADSPSNDAAKSSIGASATTSASGTGWVPVALTNISGGSPISALPLDPSGIDSTKASNNGQYSYHYMCSTTGMVFELTAYLESTRYQNAGSDDKTSTDGGTKNWLYEVGSALNL